MKEQKQENSVSAMNLKQTLRENVPFVSICVFRWKHEVKTSTPYNDSVTHKASRNWAIP